MVSLTSAVRTVTGKRRPKQDPNIRPLVHLSATEQRRHAALEDRLKRIRSRLAEIDGELAAARTEYLRGELGTERNDLQRYESVTENAIADLLAVARADERREALIRANLTARERQTRTHIERLVAIGDHREARVHRMALLDIRGDVDRELGGG